MTPPRFDMQMPPVAAPAVPTAPPNVTPPAGAGFSPLLAALLSCLGTMAVLAIVYVLTHR
jgi:hypothetical protein